MQDGVKIMIGPEAKKSVMESLDADVAFLAKNQIMDYSLILGKHTVLKVKISGGWALD